MRPDKELLDLIFIELIDKGAQTSIVSTIQNLSEGNRIHGTIPYVNYSYSLWLNYEFESSIETMIKFSGELNEDMLTINDSCARIKSQFVGYEVTNNVNLVDTNSKIKKNYTIKAIIKLSEIMDDNTAKIIKDIKAEKYRIELEKRRVLNVLDVTGAMRERRYSPYDDNLNMFS